MAAAALLELDRVLKSKKEMLTPREANILLSWKSKSLMDLAAGALGGTAAAGAATWKLDGLFRICLSAGFGTYCGPWMFNRSSYSHADQILTMDGSILQKELANITVTKYQNDPLLMRLISKHLYLERIFDDSTSNNPTLRWRYRNFFSDNAVNGHRTHDRESNDKSQGRSENVTDSKRTNLKTKRTFKNASPDIMSEGDPLDCLFGYAPPVEEIHHSNFPNKPSGIHNRARRKSHRRRRMHNHEDLSNSESAAAV
ncbi:hypothetical protein JHK87_002690 [Glycine soja]|nr:hypothetical protein JHK87_002690 [Glycine soja]